LELSVLERGPDGNGEASVSNTGIHGLAHPTEIPKEIVSKFTKSVAKY
jgi:hypothetical protein